MQENDASAPQPVTSKVETVRNSKLFVITTIILGLLAGVLGILLALEKQNAAGIVQRAANQTSQIENKAQQDSSSVPSASQEEAKPVEKAFYRADIGQFELSLPSEYYIVRLLDGKGIGGSETELLIGKRANEGTNVVESSRYGNVTVEAYAMENRGSFRELVESNTKDQNSKQLDNVTVDGVSAEVYELTGHDTGKVYFFSNEGIFYQIKTEFL